MSLESMALVANIVASLAVVLSLIFIALQLRQNAHLTRMAAAQTSAQMLSQNFGRVIEFADLAEILLCRTTPGLQLHVGEFPPL